MGGDSDQGLRAAWTRLGNRLAARRAARAQPATGFVSQPEPRTLGLTARGKQVMAGNFLFAGHLVERPDTVIWDLPAPDAAFAAALQGFGWLDDLAALGDLNARNRAQGWTWEWIARFGRGQGPGWTPDLTGRRLIRWINHALFLLNGRPASDSEAYYRTLAAQVLFLGRRWKAASPGLPRIEALTGLIYAGLSLTGMEGQVTPAARALGQECGSAIDAGGGIPTRNPEELLEVFSLLTWAAQALGEAGRPVPDALTAALARIAPCLRALRHADGGLARFHGGGRGVEGRLDQALASAGVKASAQEGLSMGFARLSGGRSSVVADVASPPGGPAGRLAHASTLAFELTSGRRPVIVNCGAGAPFGKDWRRAARATQSHSTLSLDGVSSSRFAPGGGDILAERAQVPLCRQGEVERGHHLLATHDGWLQTHGLTHARELTLSPDGRRLEGVDLLAAEGPQAHAKLLAMLTRQHRQGQEGIGFAVRFHLHPDVEASLDMGGTAVSLMLKSGEVWVFRHDGGAEGRARLGLEPSVYLDATRLMPRASRQIVLQATLTDFQSRIGWTLAKAQDTPLAIRDLERDELPSRP